MQTLTDRGHVDPADAKAKISAAAGRVFCHRGRSFRVIDDPVVAAAANEFRSGFEEGTLQFFDHVLPACTRMIDFGAHIGLTALYAATQVTEVLAFEPSPVNHAILARNVALNPELSPRIKLFRHGLGGQDARATLFCKAFADSGSSIFRTVERGSILEGQPGAEIDLKDADGVLRSIGVDDKSLLKIDIEGAEYLVLPAIAPLLAERMPFLHVSFHPYNLVVANDPFLTTVARLRHAMQAAEALAPYRYMHIFSEGRWLTFGETERMDFLRQYLLRAKPVPRIASPQYGFTDAIALSDTPLRL